MDSDASVKVRCTNAACSEYTHDDEDALEFGLWWHPRTFTEYQGERPHGGYVLVYSMESHCCPECNIEGVELQSLSL
jgi:hypothetical protein